MPAPPSRRITIAPVKERRPRRPKPVDADFESLLEFTGFYDVYYDALREEVHAGPGVCQEGCARLASAGRPRAKHACVGCPPAGASRDTQATKGLGAHGDSCPPVYFGEEPPPVGKAAARVAQGAQKRKRLLKALQKREREEACADS